MTVAQLVKELQNYPQDMEIQIECPNGLMIVPKVKHLHSNYMDPFSPVVELVLAWRD